MRSYQAKILTPELSETLLKLFFQLSDQREITNYYQFIHFHYPQLLADIQNYDKLFLHKIIETNRLPLLQLTLATLNENILLSRDEHYATPLHLAAEKTERKECCLALIEHIREICKSSSEKQFQILNTVDENGQTPLSLAVQADNLNCVYALLENGADPRWIVDTTSILEDMINRNQLNEEMGAILEKNFRHPYRADCSEKHHQFDLLIIYEKLSARYPDNEPLKKLTRLWYISLSLPLRVLDKSENYDCYSLLEKRRHYHQLIKNIGDLLENLKGQPDTIPGPRLSAGIVFAAIITIAVMATQSIPFLFPNCYADDPHQDDCESSRNRLYIAFFGANGIDITLAAGLFIIYYYIWEKNNYIQNPVWQSFLTELNGLLPNVDENLIPELQFQYNAIRELLPSLQKEKLKVSELINYLTPLHTALKHIAQLCNKSNEPLSFFRFESITAAETALAEVNQVTPSTRGLGFFDTHQREETQDDPILVEVSRQSADLEQGTSGSILPDDANHAEDTEEAPLILRRTQNRMG